VDPLAGYAVVFLWSFLAATVLPLGSEIPFAALVRQEGRLLLPVVVATAGNSLGAFTTYWLGRRAAAVAESRGVRSPRAQRAAALLRRHGRPIVFFSWVPILGDALVAGAGAAHMPVPAFAAWVMLGKLFRYALLAWGVLALE
jgi:membrane protein YqaA with SNARE-associated domain